MPYRDALPSAVRLAKCGLLFLSLALVGCGPAVPSVTGSVLFAGRPLTSGTVLFHGADGHVGHGLITEEGRYTVANAPPGPVRITVQSHAARPAGLPSNGDPPPAAPIGLGPLPKDQRIGTHVPIPPRYLDPEQSGLTYTVRAGRQKHDIELQP